MRDLVHSANEAKEDKPHAVASLFPARYLLAISLWDLVRGVKQEYDASVDDILSRLLRKTKNHASTLSWGISFAA